MRTSGAGVGRHKSALAPSQHDGEDEDRERGKHADADQQRRAGAFNLEARVGRSAALLPCSLNRIGTVDVRQFGSLRRPVGRQRIRLARCTLLRIRCGLDAAGTDRARSQSR